MNECRLLLVEAMQAVGLFVDEGVVLGHELPTHLSGVGGLGGVLPRGRGRCSSDISGHYSVLVVDGGVQVYNRMGARACELQPVADKRWKTMHSRR